MTFNTGGVSVTCDGSSPVLHCSDIYGNTGGDWVGCIAGQAGINGNFEADPLYCNAATGDFGLLAASPCLPGQHPHGEDCGLVGALPAGCNGSPTSVMSWPGGVAGEARFSLGPCLPNPLHPAATILYTIPPAPAPGRVTLRVYDATGRAVRTLVDQPGQDGRHSARWDGCDQAGRPVASGIYFCQLGWADHRMTERLVLVR